jgi:DNA repair exonuclease SbcCD ATPase subunit
LTALDDQLQAWRDWSTYQGLLAQATLQQSDAIYQTLQQQLADGAQQVNKLERELVTLEYRFSEQTRQQARIATITADRIALEQAIEPLSIYHSLIGNRGIVSKILCQRIAQMESKINETFAAATQYQLHIQYNDSKETLNMLLSRDASERPMTLVRLSGYERLMLSISVRRALSYLSYQSRSGLMIIDEGLDCVDAERFTEQLPNLIEHIGQDYEQILVISQRDISHLADQSLEIRREAGISSLSCADYSSL